MQNIMHNFMRNIEPTVTRPFPSAQQHWWGEEVQEELKRPDVVIGADIVYGEDDEVWRLLIQSIMSIATGDTLVLLSHTRRYAKDERFFRSMRRFFDALAEIDLSSYCGSNTRLYAFRKKETGGITSG